jgi:hypothetical protein
MAMVVAGLASSGAASAPSTKASSVVIGCIPLLTSAALLLHNMVKVVAFLRRKSVEVVRETGAGGRPQQRQGQLTASSKPMLPPSPNCGLMFT